MAERQLDAAQAATRPRAQAVETGGFGLQGGSGHAERLAPAIAGDTDGDGPNTGMMGPAGLEPATKPL